MKYISVFCGSSMGNDPIYAEQAKQLGQAIARRNYGLVYGGARVGLMGLVADAALREGGEVIGVLPRFLMDKELQHNSLSQLHIVDTMHERKAKMHELGHAVVALPGGYGTMEELFEVLTWSQLALHNEPVGLLNVDGFYDSLLQLSSTMIEKGFLSDSYRNLLLVDTDVETLIDKLEQYIPSTNNKWK